MKKTLLSICCLLAFTACFENSNDTKTTKSALPVDYSISTIYDYSSTTSAIASQDDISYLNLGYGVLNASSISSVAFRQRAINLKDMIGSKKNLNHAVALRNITSDYKKMVTWVHQYVPSYDLSKYEFTSNSVMDLYLLYVEDSEISLNEIKLPEDLITLKTNNITNFKALYGDSYISSVKQGFFMVNYYIYDNVDQLNMTSEELKQQLLSDKPDDSVLSHRKSGGITITGKISSKSLDTIYKSYTNYSDFVKNYDESIRPELKKENLVTLDMKTTNY